MKVKVKFFASLRERVGESELTMELEQGSSIRELWGVLERAYPKLAPIRVNVLCAVNKEYVDAERLLQDEDEVVFVPPVSGG